MSPPPGGAGNAALFSKPGQRRALHSSATEDSSSADIAVYSAGHLVKLEGGNLTAPTCPRARASLAASLRHLASLLKEPR